MKVEILLKSCPQLGGWKATLGIGRKTRNVASRSPRMYEKICPVSLLTRSEAYRHLIQEKLI